MEKTNESWSQKVSHVMLVNSCLADEQSICVNQGFRQAVSIKDNGILNKYLYSY